jgi:hypothetical protein
MSDESPHTAGTPKRDGDRPAAETPGVEPRHETNVDMGDRRRVIGPRFGRLDGGAGAIRDDPEPPALEPFAAAQERAARVQPADVRIRARKAARDAAVARRGPLPAAVPDEMMATVPLRDLEKIETRMGQMYNIITLLSLAIVVLALMVSRLMVAADS